MFDRLTFCKLIVALSAVAAVVRLIFLPSPEIGDLMRMGGLSAAASSFLILTVSIRLVVEATLSLAGRPHHESSTFPWMAMAATCLGYVLVLVKSDADPHLAALMFACGVASCGIAFSQGKSQLQHARNGRTQ